MAMAQVDIKCPRPWDPRHEEGQKDVRDDETLMEFLMGKLPCMIDQLELNERLWTLLKQKEVLTDQNVSSIQGASSKRLKLMKLASYLIDSKVYQFHHFIWATVNVGQPQVVAVLKLDVNTYFDRDIFLKSSRFYCPACQEMYTVKAYILSACGHYVCRPCIKGAKFTVNDDKSQDITCPVTDCGEVTKTAHTNGDIGLPEDVEFMLVAGKVEECLSKSTGATKVKTHLLNKAQKQMDVVNKSTDILKTYNKTVKLRGEKLLKYIYDEQEKAKAKIDQWVAVNKKIITATSLEVATKLQRSTHWGHTMSNIVQMLAAGVSLPNNLQCPDMQLSPEAAAFLDKLIKGLPAINIVSSFPYHEPDRASCSPPPTKAKLLTRWIVPDTSESAPHIAWHPAGHLLVADEPGLYQLQFNAETSKWLPTLIHRAHNPWEISVARDGSWLLSQEGKFVIHTEGHCTLKEPNIPGLEMHKAIIHDSGIYVTYIASSIIESRDRNFVKQKEYNLGESFEDCGKQISVTKTGDVLVTAFDRICVLDPHTGVQRYIQFKVPVGRKPAISIDACVFGHTDGQYILVVENFDSDYCVSVYSYEGQFLHELDIEGGRAWTYYISVLDRPGQDSLMALCTSGDDDDEYGCYYFVVKIFSLK